MLFPCAGDELSLLVAAELVGGDFECPVAAGSYVQYALVPGCPPQSSFPARLREYWSPSARPISHFGRLLATTVCLCTGRNACSIYSRETDYAAYWRGRPTPACNGSMVSLGGTRLRSYPPRIHIVPLHSGVKRSGTSAVTGAPSSRRERGCAWLARQPHKDTRHTELPAHTLHADAQRHGNKKN